MPPPPHADARKILLSASVCNNLEPAGTTIGLAESPLISIDTLPVDTNLDLAAIITRTSKITIPQNDTTPRIKSILIVYKDIPPNDINPKLINPTIIKVAPRPLRPSGISEYFNFSLIPASTTIAKAQPKPAPKP